MNRTKQPWEEISPSVAAVLQPAIPALVEEIIDAVQAAVPAYERGLDRNVRTGVQQALEGFLALVAGGDPPELPGHDVYFSFGRGEARSGRSLDALLSAYRAGARVAWRGLAAAGVEAQLDPQDLYTLAEGIFAFIDEISAVTAEGYTYEESLAMRERHEHRRRLLEALLRKPQPPADELQGMAERASWALPERVAALAFEADQLDRTGARLAEPILYASLEGLGWALVPDPAAPGRRAELRAALRDARSALGPNVRLDGVPESARRARLALDALASDRLVAADDHLLELILHSGGSLSDDLARRRLAPLDALPATTRERLLETLAAWLDCQGEARPAAELLHVHVQTVRYRLGQLRDVLGGALDDPRGRLELALALQVRGRA
ncbi:MAG TPA: helix-turn-helix domain-containing protein [Thermoleophilaceae bacterium]|nr:helix-turn-helix domain-containing protein [Thermoleophilaceae bacterium]